MSAIVLLSKPGLTSLSAGLTIPATWDPVWFKNLINNVLKGADVRNAIAGPGITITGNLASPYATISATGAIGPAPIIVKTTPGGVTVFEVFNSLTGPTVQAYGPAAGGLVDMTPDASNFVGNVTGCTTAIPTTVVWSKNGNQVTLSMGAGTGTSNATACTVTGLPAEIQPTRIQLCTCIVYNNSAITAGTAQVTAGSGTITFFVGAAGSFTATGSKGMNLGTFSYLLN
jgi:hypothetical protein